MSLLGTDRRVGARHCEPDAESGAAAVGDRWVRSRRGSPRSVAALVACFLLAAPGALLGQDPEPDPESPPASVESGEEEVVRRWWNGWSVPSDRHRLYLGVWSAHTFESDFPDFFSNRGLGVQYRGLFGVTFVNSYGDQSLAIGTERSWLQWSSGPLHAMLGFRAGLIYGYDDKLIDVAGVMPVLPLMQPMAMLRLGPLTADLGFVPRVMSVTGAFTF